MTTPNDKHTPDHKSKTFFIESGDFFRVRELRTAGSEHEIRRDIEAIEPWRLPVTIVEVSHD